MKLHKTLAIAFLTLGLACSLSLLGSRARCEDTTPVDGQLIAQTASSSTDSSSTTDPTLTMECDENGQNCQEVAPSSNTHQVEGDNGSDPVSN